MKSLNHANLKLVCQIHTTGGFLRDPDGYIYCDSYNVEDHKHDFAKQLKECSDLIQQVNAGGFINVHSGVDAWTKTEALDFLVFALEQVANTNLCVTFETHRQRLFGNPFQTRELLADARLGSLKLNADLSHWYCACERVFDPAEGRDAVWWPHLLDHVLSKHCYYIHARFGWSQGPQMADPSIAECDTERNLQESVWKTLIKAMAKRKEEDYCFVQPEYGPFPYMPVHPETQEPIASLPAAVSFTKGRIESLFDDAMREMK